MTDGDGEEGDEDVRHRYFIAVATGDYDDPRSPALDVAGEAEEFERWLCGDRTGQARVHADGTRSRSDQGDDRGRALA